MTPLLPRRLYIWVRRHWRDFQARRQPAAEREAQALISWPRAGSAELFYIFQGRRARQLMEPLTFLRATGLIDVNLVLARDVNQFFYHGGISTELPDFESLHARLLAARNALPQVQRSYTLGASMGGHAAIVFGHYLEADVVYAFSPQTLIDLPRLGRMARRKDTWRFPPEHVDLALLLARHNGRTRYRLFYCADSPRDREFAERLRDCPGVELCPQPGDSHQVVELMHAEGRLLEALARR